MAITNTVLRRRIVTLCEARGPDKTCCPSDVARGFGENWRALLPRLRQQAAVLAAEGVIYILQNGRPVSGSDIRGPIRLALRTASSART